MKLLDIYGKIKHDLNYVEKELEQSVYTDHDFLRQTSLHLLKAGGKRIRPVFVLLSGKFGNYRIERMRNIAVPLELIHMATLVHDDVIDNAQTRRGQLTVKSKWDNRVAMYTGDFIFAKALTMVTELSNVRVHQILSKAVVEMCIGEMEQIRFFFEIDQKIRDYLLRIKRKTALLIAISCQLGAIAADAGEEAARKLYAYGYNVGMAFQIRDDILDLTGTEKQLGKPPGSDIKQGNITLPVLYALRDPALREKLLIEISSIQQEGSDADASVFLHIIRNSDGIKQADQLAGKYIDKAIHALSTLPDISAKQDLIEIAYFVGNRQY